MLLHQQVFFLDLENCFVVKNLIPIGIWEHLLPKKQVWSRIVRKKSAQKTEILGGKQKENMFSKRNENDIKKLEK